MYVCVHLYMCVYMCVFYLASAFDRCVKLAGWSTLASLEEGTDTSLRRIFVSVGTRPVGVS